jgi:multidrug efflux system membrane fusion protein
MVLLRNDFAARQTVDQNRATLDQAKAQIQKTQAIIGEKLILAPFDGILGIRQVNLGQYIGSGTNIVSLTNLSVLHVDFRLAEQDASKLTMNQNVDLSIDAVPGRTFKAQITAIEPRVSEATRMLTLRATLENTGAILRPGMYAQVSVVLAHRDTPCQRLMTVPGVGPLISSATVATIGGGDRAGSYRCRFFCRCRWVCLGPLRRSCSVD